MKDKTFMFLSQIKAQDGQFISDYKFYTMRWFKVPKVEHRRRFKIERSVADYKSSKGGHRPADPGSRLQITNSPEQP